jgi:hypothetical protein
MIIVQIVEHFFTGVFLCNSIPHLVAGLQGQPFPTPFSKPRGVADSPPLLNILWGFINLTVGLSLLAVAPVSIGLNLAFVSVLLGAAALGSYVAVHFGKCRATGNLERAGGCETADRPT